MNNIVEQEAVKQKSPIRNRRPKGALGFLAYFADRLIFHFNKSVDWLAARAGEEYGYTYLADTEPDLALLDEVETEIFKFLAQGLSSIEIGEKLGMSANIVGNATRALKEKLGLYHPVDITALAIKHGIM